MREIKGLVDLAIEEALLDLKANGTLPDVPEEKLRASAYCDVNSDTSRGDLSTTCCLQVAKMQKMNPKQLADTAALQIAEKLTDVADKVRADGPGFLNIILKKDVYLDLARKIRAAGKTCGQQPVGHGKKVNVEFVSANPTGPLSVAHGRQAAVGDTIVRILSRAGDDVTREYFLNDTGNQINVLGRSIYARLLDEAGKPSEFPEEGYKGEYISDIAADILKEKADILELSEEDAVDCCADLGVRTIMTWIREDLEAFHVNLDVWTSQKDLEKSGIVEEVLSRLQKEDRTYEKEDATWFKGTEFGDFQDKVLVKADGTYTYRTPDIAYHYQKYTRGFEKMIDLWGPDHHGHIPCIESAMRSLGLDANALDLRIVQQCTLWKGKEKVKMSTRAGTFVTLRELMEEVGEDAARFFFLMRKMDSQMDFDMELAKQRTMENPVYYVQYAHARVVGIAEHALKDERFTENDFEDHLYCGNAEHLDLLREEDLKLIPAMGRFPVEVDGAARNLDPQRMTNYAHELSTVFQRYYTLGKKDASYRVVTDDTELTKARLYLVAAFGVTIRAVLDVLGISAPDRM